MTMLAVAAVPVEFAAAVGHVVNNKLGRTGICRFPDPDSLPFDSLRKNDFPAPKSTPHRGCRADYEADTKTLSLQGVHRSLVTAS